MGAEDGGQWHGYWHVLARQHWETVVLVLSME